MSLRLQAIVKAAYIDWDDTAIFENGKVVSFKNKSTTNNYSLKPIPSDDKSISDARDAKQSIADILKPPTKESFAAMFKILTLNYNHQAKNTKDWGIVSGAWEFDLGGYPKVLLQQVFGDLRRDGDQKFMPNIGEVIKRLDIPLNKIKRVERRVNKILGIEEQKEISLLEQLNKLI